MEQTGGLGWRCVNVWVDDGGGLVLGAVIVEVAVTSGGAPPQLVLYPRALRGPA